MTSQDITPGLKFLSPALSTIYNDIETFYSTPQPGEKCGPWTEHPEPAEPDGNDCGPGRYCFKKFIDAEDAPANWWPWYAQTRNIVGESGEEFGATQYRLRRIPVKTWWYVLRRGYCRQANLRFANLREANLRGADLMGANLGKADLRQADLWGADLWVADLWKANLRESILGQADLRHVNLWGADLWEATLWNADLRFANLREANLRGAYLEGADLMGANLRGASHDEHTIWPASFDKKRLEVRG